MRIGNRQLRIIFFVAAGLVCGCEGGQSLNGYYVSTGGYPEHGKRVIAQYRCGRCHEIPGVENASGVFGPPLLSMGRRTYIAGEFPNEPQYMVHWIQSPESMKPKTAMPDLGLSEQQAKDAAAYLYTLR